MSPLCPLHLPVSAGDGVDGSWYIIKSGNTQRPEQSTNRREFMIQLRHLHCQGANELLLLLLSSSSLADGYHGYLNLSWEPPPRQRSEKPTWRIIDFLLVGFCCCCSFLTLSLGAFNKTDPHTAETAHNPGGDADNLTSTIFHFPPSHAVCFAIHVF